jgi:hypothetical protein
MVLGCYLHKNKLLFTADFQKELEGIKYSSTYEKYYNQNIDALGLEILPQKRTYTSISMGFLIDSA